MHALLLAAALADPTAPDLAFMRGEWLACREGETVEEHWVGPGPFGLVGLTATTRGERGEFEHARIARTAEGWAFFASPGGAPPTVFTLVEHDAASAVFENPEHDFPKRVAYRREGRTLRASATDLSGSGSFWVFRPRSDGPC